MAETLVEEARVLESAAHLFSKAVVRRVDSGRFLNHLWRHYPESFDPTDGCFVLGEAVARISFIKNSMIITVMASDDASLRNLKGILAYQLQNWPGTDFASIVWMGDGAGPVDLPHFRQMRLVNVQNITPGFCRLELAGEDLHRFAQGGFHVRLLLPPRGRTPVWPHAGPGGLPIWPRDRDRLILRTYTLRQVLPDQGLVSIDIFRHQPEGAVQNWLDHAVAGDLLGIMGPGGGGVPKADWVCLAGDETALPAIARILENLPPATCGFALLEVDNAREMQDLQAPEGVEIVWLLRNGVAPGRSSLLVEAVRNLPWPGSGSVFAFAGAEFETYKLLRHEYRKVRGLRRNQHQAVAYWWLGRPEA
ncbi:siderophore-interacting protein [Aureimonas fodinaquatilis]|uniref:Siderophore-interacting protein n=1 Tax=Aureimonas fodinaquatilis TaxID=2565783 RepID=A0A5B0DZD7_9HYPH|nr:siderophore-interacting protein [Aureimonas fodinaquatilis]KAA0970910.1 siderophore-interacting protein [Aureimonas fodinaquatilis]